MAVRRILQLGDPLLRLVSQPSQDHNYVRSVFADLADTLHEFQRTQGFGRGISAIQIGEPLRAIYIEIGGASYSLLQPVFDEMSGDKFVLWDDCFSFPNLMVRLERSCGVRLSYQDESGSLCSLTAEGPFSELLQHEMDHLDGILAVDRALDRDSFCTREEWLRRYRA